MIDKEIFINDNITQINNTGAKKFITDGFDVGTSPFSTITEVQNFLKEKLLADIRNSKDRLKSELWNAYKEVNFVKAKILEIANKHKYLKKDIEELLIREAKQQLVNKYDKESFKSLISPIMATLDNEESKAMGFKTIKTEIENGLSGFFYMALQGGFPVNLQEINLGTMTSNAGDSAQFIFVGRAILAGFNCSNVDVRSSRYDVIIDYKSKLLRIQVKGISGGSTVSFYDRARGGQGIDHTHNSNIGKRITREDCDFYAAVDKRSGMCYIIPMSFADALQEKDAKSTSLKELEAFKENWKIFEDLSKEGDKKNVVRRREYTSPVKRALKKSPRMVKN